MRRLSAPRSARSSGMARLKAAVVMLALIGCSVRSTADRADSSAGSAVTVTKISGETAATSAAPIGNTATSIEPAETTETVARSLRCTPSTLRPGDTLTLHMGTPHGRDLRIHSPARIEYYLVYPGLGRPPRNYSITPSEEFRKLTTYPVPSDVKAIPLVKGRDTIRESVFSDSGKYTIVMGEHLNSDYGYWSSECAVTFLPR